MVNSAEYTYKRKRCSRKGFAKDLIRFGPILFLKFKTLFPLQETDRQELSARLAQEQEATALARQEAEQERLLHVKQLEDMELKIR